MTNSEYHEEWRPVVGFEGAYEVSSFGRVRRLPYVQKQGGRTLRHKGRILKGTQSSPRRGSSYKRVSVMLCRDGNPRRFTAHRLVLQAYCGSSDGECRHLNGDSTDNRIWNLAWGTKLENREDMILHGTHGRKLDTMDVISIKHLCGYFNQREVAKKFGITQAMVSSIVCGKSWKHL